MNSKNHEITFQNILRCWRGRQRRLLMASFTFKLKPPLLCFRRCGGLPIICKDGGGAGVWSWPSLKVQPGWAVCRFWGAPVSWAAPAVLHTKKQQCKNITRLRTTALYACEHHSVCTASYTGLIRDLTLCTACLFLASIPDVNSGFCVLLNKGLKSYQQKYSLDTGWCFQPINSGFYRDKIKIVVLKVNSQFTQTWQGEQSPSSIMSDCLLRLNIQSPACLTHNRLTCRLHTTVGTSRMRNDHCQSDKCWIMIVYLKISFYKTFISTSF